MGKELGSICRRISFICVATLMLVIQVSNTVVHAQEVPPSEETVASTETVAAEEEVVPPPKYVYNAETGLWENGTYSWDPVTHQTTPLKEVTYSYNPETEKWDTTEWKSSTTGEYGPNTIQPQLDELAPALEGSNTDAEKSNLSPTTHELSGPDSLNETTDKQTGEYFFDGFYNVTISGVINSSAQSGNALVSGNTYGGNATSGNAYTYASLLNMVQTSFGTPTYYSSNIQGSYTGDLQIDPGELAVSNTNITKDTQLTVTQTQELAILNDVYLTADSGDATVSGNTEAGNATSGDAQAVATIMNLISTSIAANESFIGVLNIFGDFEGDVLLASELTDKLLASNVPTAEISLSNTTDIDVAIDSAITIDNNLQLAAESGDATVSGNTVGGSAASGSASTNVTVFNLTGQQIITQNALLVFVNVSGEWIGFITNAPAGATAAMLGSGESSLVSGVEADYNIDGSFNIVNNVYASAATGDATVAHNTIGGNATSGDAQASANILNIVNSTFSVNSWFGALFINVFGNWYGSFGTDTAYGGFSTREDDEKTVGGIGGESLHSGTAPKAPVVYIAGEDGTFRAVGSSFTRGSGFGGSAPPQVAAVAQTLADESSPGTSSVAAGGDSEAAQAVGMSWLLIVAVVVGTGVLAWRQYGYTRSASSPTV